MSTKNAEEFRKKVQTLDREDIIDLIRAQDVELVKQIKRIEYVFSNKLSHLTWSDGSEVLQRPLSKEELSYILDPPFKEDPDLTALGLTIDQQRQVHVAADPVLWAKNFLGAKPRVYQILMLRHPKLRKVFRAGRRLGKSYTLAVTMLHYAYTHKNGRVLVMAPMKDHVGVIYKEVMKLASGGNGSVKESMVRYVTSPQYEIEFSNGSTIKFFTTGLRSGGRSDVARGQEANLIILDELDYMGPDDLDALYAMLQKTDEAQEDKVLIGASTPTGRRERFWQWCNGLSKDGERLPEKLRFKEFWFPSYVNPNFTRDVEEEFRSEYGEMAYRHEIEADWGEDVEGVYPRKFVDKSFLSPGWKYIEGRTSARSNHLIGVDWDKYGAGPNIVVLEACNEDYEDERFANKLRIAYRQEIPKNEYVLTQAVERVIELNAIFNPSYIYVDRGYGDTQYELLMKYGVEHPVSGFKKKLKGISFSQTIEMKDPHTKQPIKKEIKPFMVDNLRTLLENGEIVFPEEDEELYMQLISYVVLRTTATGRPVFEASGSQVDHAHDALILACLAYTQNYGDLMKVNLARRARSISSDPLLPMFEPPKYLTKEQAEEIDDSVPIKRVRSGIPRGRRSPQQRAFQRKTF